MANMSYCRFSNTLNDLRDCEQALNDDPPTEDGSPEEYRAMKNLIRLCGVIWDENQHLVDEARRK
jgi:hypothetical protein